ncbi:B12-binding domain-containing radical SAM protein [Chloroflexota bacterium]
MLYPEFPDSFWSLKGIIKSISKKANCPPLGILTVAAMLPSDWELKLIDLNVSSMGDEDIESADWVFISAMVVQKESVARLINRCKRLNARIVAGGPLFTINYDDYDHVDCIVLGEAEATVSSLISDLESGSVRHIYRSEMFVPLSQTPVPLWSLINTNDYMTLAIQCSRGCPFDCEFCDIVALNGDKPRIKPADNVISELEAIYNIGWRGSIFIADDNFVGNKRQVKDKLLPAIKQWSDQKNFCFWYNTQASINIADDEELMNQMFEVGFCQVFVGIESVDEDCLVECGKTINQGRNLISSVKTLQNHGLEVQCGLIVGFDSDPPSIFQNLVDFIQNSGIVTSMVSLLAVQRGTRLYERMKAENRLLKEWTGDNTDGSVNFIPKMDMATLMNGYKYIINTLYSPEYFYKRMATFLKEYKLQTNAGLQYGAAGIIDVLKTLKRMFIILLVLGIQNDGRMDFWRQLLYTIIRRPRYVPVMLNLSMIGLHLRKWARRTAP